MSHVEGRRRGRNGRCRRKGRNTQCPIFKWGGGGRENGNRGGGGLGEKEAEIESNEGALSRRLDATETVALLFLVRREMRLEGGGAILLAGFGCFGGLFLEMFLEAEAFAAFGRSDAFAGAVGLDLEGVGVVLEAGLEVANEAAAAGGVFDGDEELDTFFKVAGHPVGRGDEDLGGAAVVEVKGPGVFEEAVDDGDDADVFGGLASAGFEAADAADVELDVDAGAGRLVEGIDDVGVLQRIHLGHDAGLFAMVGAVGLGFDEFEDALLHEGRRREEFFETDEFGSSGDRVEDEGGIGAVLGTAGEVGKVGVELCGGLVVVAGAEVDVAAESAVFVSGDESDFGVGFEALHSVDDADAGALEGLGTLEVALLIEAGLEFDEDGDLFTILRGAGEGADDARVAGGAVEDLLDVEDVGVDGGFLEESDHGLEGFEGVDEEDVPLGDGVEHGGAGVDEGGWLGEPGFIAEEFVSGEEAELHEIGESERTGEAVELISAGAGDLLDDIE